MSPCPSSARHAATDEDRSRRRWAGRRQCAARVETAEGAPVVDEVYVRQDVVGWQTDRDASAATVAEVPGARGLRQRSSRKLPSMPLPAEALEPESSRWRLQSTFRLSVRRTCTPALPVASMVLLIGRGSSPTGVHAREWGGV